MMNKQTAAVLIIGDEILRGQVVDMNTSYIANSLYAAGINLCKVITVPDLTSDIAKEVKSLSKTYSIVFTSGGVGPTHDDVTYEAVSEAFELKLEQNLKLTNLYTELFPNESELHRLTTVPYPCEVIQIEGKQLQSTYAVIKVQNVYILPGSPKYFRLAVDEIMLRLQGGTPLFNTYIEVALNELAIVKVLNEHVARWKGTVSFGSYPETEPTVRTKITFEGNREAVLKAKQDFVASLPSSVVITNEKFTLKDAQAVIRCSTGYIHVKNALNILERCYDTYNANEIFMSFNGGKDCTVVLHLVATVMRCRGLESLLCLYISGDSFPEVDEFVDKTVEYYGLTLVKKEISIQTALTHLLEEKPEIKACIMGMRRTDPGSENLQPFAQTDSGWPPLMRINPILDWTYKQVWDFLLMHNISYCPLYDQGYTSLGRKSKTIKNPLLKNPSDLSSYLPAYTLLDDSTEREGRR